MKTEIEVGDCYGKIKDADDIYVHRVVAMIGKTHCYVETIRKEKKTVYEPDDSYSRYNSAIEKDQFAHWNIWLSLDIHDRSKAAEHYETISHSQYEEIRKEVLGLMGLQNPDSPLFRHIFAAQKASEAEALIRLAVKLEKESPQ